MFSTYYEAHQSLKSLDWLLQQTSPEAQTLWEARTWHPIKVVQMCSEQKMLQANLATGSHPNPRVPRF